MKSSDILLRAVEPRDAALMYQWENERRNWYVSATTSPMPLFLIEEFAKAENQDIQKNQQLRLIIVLQQTQLTIGYIDLFDVDFINGRAGVGILIGMESQRNKGFAKQAVALLKQYARVDLNLNQLFCNVHISNINSIKLFEAAGFDKCGLLKKWSLKNNHFDDVLVMQCFLKTTNE